MPESEARRARARFALVDGRGLTVASGEGEALVGGEVLSIGPVSASFLDAEELRARDRVVELDLWPSGRLTLSQLGRRFETFTAALKEARNRARVAGFLAHGLSTPQVFQGFCLEPEPSRQAQFLVYGTHLTVVPEEGDPFQVPYGALTSFQTSEPNSTVTGESGEGRFVFGQFGRQREPFFRAVSALRDGQGQRLSELTGSTRFSDGLGVPAPELSDFDRLLGAFTAPERKEMAEILLRSGRGAPPRLGLVEILDPDERSLRAPRRLPENVAAFLLVPVGARVILEIISGPSAATYAFQGEIDSINRDLQLLHFRRSPLALSDEEMAGQPGDPYRLAMRKLDALKRLRSARLARIIHGDSWGSSLQEALG